RDLLLQRCHLGTQDEPLGFEDPVDCDADFVPDGCVLGAQVQQRYLAGVLTDGRCHDPALVGQAVGYCAADAPLLTSRACSESGNSRNSRSRAASASCVYPMRWYDSYSRSSAFGTTGVPG